MLRTNCWWTALDPVYGESLVMNQSTAHALYIHRHLAPNVGRAVGHTTSQRLEHVSDFFSGGFLKMGVVENTDPPFRSILVIC